MKIGLALPHMGEQATAENIRSFAVYAERNGWDSLWTGERLLHPVNPKTPYPAKADGKLKPATKRVFEHLTVLSYVAYCRSRGRCRAAPLGPHVWLSPAFRNQKPPLLHRHACALRRPPRLAAPPVSPPQPPRRPGRPDEAGAPPETPCSRARPPRCGVRGARRGSRCTRRVSATHERAAACARTHPAALGTHRTTEMTVSHLGSQNPAARFTARGQRSVGL
jgi:hypothetical protein